MTFMKSLRQAMLPLASCADSAYIQIMHVTNQQPSCGCHILNVCLFVNLPYAVCTWVLFLQAGTLCHVLLPDAYQ